MNGTRGVSVRRATSADLRTIVALRLALLREYQDHPVYGRVRPDLDRVARDVFARQLESSMEASFLAEADGDGIGMLRCVETLASPLFVPDRYCYVSSAYVRPQYRKRGVLRALLTEARRWCDERGLTEMRLSSVGPGTTAAAAWDALGFGVVEQVRVLRLPTADDASAREHLSHGARSAPPHEARSAEAQ